MSNSASGLIDWESRFVVTDQQITSQLGDESVILGLNEGIYYGLDEIGTRIWTQLQSPRSINEICDNLAQDFDVERATCGEAVTALLQDMEARGLLERSP
jgi:hypothetical protein